MKPKRRIHRFNFDQEKMQSGGKTHVALVDEAANLTSALVLKSTSIRQSTEISTTDENGDYTHETETVNVEDYGGDNIYVTHTNVRVVETRHPKINVISN